MYNSLISETYKKCARWRVIFVIVAVLAVNSNSNSSSFYVEVVLIVCSSNSISNIWETLVIAWKSASFLLTFSKSIYSSSVCMYVCLLPMHTLLLILWA